MKTFQYVCMGITFLMAGLSAMMFWGQGFAYWCWQIITMIWIMNNFINKLTIDRLEKQIDNLKNKK